MHLRRSGDFESNPVTDNQLADLPDTVRPFPIVFGRLHDLYVYMYVHLSARLVEHATPLCMVGPCTHIY